MSVRVMADGKAYDRTACREVRTCSGARPGTVRPWLCVCGGSIYPYPAAKTGYRHNPGTFWENDTPRWR